MTVTDTESVIHLKASELVPDPNNLRADVGDVDDLAKSIAAVGILNPLLVRVTAEGFVIVAGHRRHAAVVHGQKSKLLPADFQVPCLLRDTDDQQTTLTMLIENLQREDLDPLEEARGLAQLQAHGMKQKDIAASVGRSPAHVSRRLGLLALPEVLQKRIVLGELSMDDAAELVKIKDEEVLAELASASRLDSHTIQTAVTKVERRKAMAAKQTNIVAQGIEQVYVSSGYGDRGRDEFLAKIAEGAERGQVLAQVGVTHDDGKKIPKGAVACVLTSGYDQSAVFYGWIASAEKAGKEIVTPTGKTKSAPVPKSDEEKDRARKDRERRELEDSFLRSVVAKPKKGDVAAYAFDLVFDLLHYGNAVDVANLLEVTQPDGSPFPRSGDAKALDAVKQYGKVNDANRLRLAMALVALRRRPDVLKEYGFSVTEQRKAAAEDAG